MEKSHSESSDILTAKSIREGVFKLLMRKPFLKAKELCFRLKLDYKAYGAQVTQRRYEWLHGICRNSLLESGVGSKGSPDEQHHVRAEGFVPKSLDRREHTEVVAEAVKAGWTCSTNRNRALIWGRHRSSYGRIEWWETGKVSVHVRAPQTMGRVKQLLSYAFYESGLIFDSRVFDAFMKQVQWHGWTGAHDVFNTEQKLPYKVIRNYEQYGFVIKAGDRSHPNAIEVEWVRPDYAEKLEILMEVNMRQLIEFKGFLQDLSTPKPLDKSVMPGVV
jgi:hypothetical protein